MKVWKDVDEVVKATIEVPKELWECEEEMKKIPKKWNDEYYIKLNDRTEKF